METIGSYKGLGARLKTSFYHWKAFK